MSDAILIAVIATGLVLTAINLFGWVRPPVSVESIEIHEIAPRAAGSGTI